MEPIAFKSQDFWFKVVDFLQQNWALVEPDESGEACTVHFITDTSGVFDALPFDSVSEAEAALRRNGFARYAEAEVPSFIYPPEPPFMAATHPNGPIYSSGRFWQ